MSDDDRATQPTTRLILLGCVASKRDLAPDQRVKARDLYDSPLWRATGAVMEWDDLLDHIDEYEAEYPGNMIPQCRTDEYRAATVDDFDCFDLAEMLWWCLDDRIPEHEGLYHDEGYPALTPLSSLPSKRFALHGLAMAIRHVLEEHLDLSGAAAQPTGRFRVRTVDGEWSAP